MRKSGKVKVHILIPEDLLVEIDQLVGKRKRSWFFTEAAVKELKRLKLKDALAKAAGVWKDEAHPDIADQGTYRWIRELREESEERFERMETHG